MRHGIELLILGHHSCLGRALSTDTMRYVVARLVKNYRFRLPHGDDGSSTLRDMTDRFASNPGALSLCFERRDSELEGI